MISFESQLRSPNFIGKDGNFYLVRCFNCGGTENYLPAVASGVCAWCGWSKERAKDDKEKI
jgi:ribosomal protein L37E